MIQFFAIAKKVTSTIKPDQKGKPQKHVQVMLEMIIDDGQSIQPIEALQETDCLQVTCEPIGLNTEPEVRRESH